MPDQDSSPPSRVAKCSQSYLIGTPPATPSLRSILLNRITTHGPLAFPDFMAAALYHPTLGYYARQTRQVGKNGDFFTSVSVGPLFGSLLARRFLREWIHLGKPARWRIIESGAHDGTLAADVLHTLQDIDAQAFAALEYVIPEPLPTLQAAQRATLEKFATTVRFLETPRSLTDFPLPGIAFGNELLDALPFHRIEWRDGKWLECQVDVSSTNDFCWSLAKIHDPALRAAADRITATGGPFPDGYRTEVRTQFLSFLAPLARALDPCLMIWVDYGFARPVFYHPARIDGTLRTFSNHQAAENPLLAPGEADITAHVDFTAVAEAAATLGGRPLDFRNQGAWLTDAARHWLAAQDGQPEIAALRQFQTLTHPAHLGGCFHFLELSWNPTPSRPPAETLAHRLFYSNPSSA